MSFDSPSPGSEYYSVNSPGSQATEDDGLAHGLGQLTIHSKYTSSTRESSPKPNAEIEPVLPLSQPNSTSPTDSSKASEFSADPTNPLPAVVETEPIQKDNIETTTATGTRPRKRPRLGVYFQSDAGKGHVYARTADSSTIVERPERIRAVMTGVAAAYSRLETRWAHQSAAAKRETEIQSTKIETEEIRLENLMQNLGIKEEKKQSRNLLNGPFDVIFSTETAADDAAAIQFIHPEPNLPPIGWTTPKREPEPRQPLPTVSRTSPRKQQAVQQGVQDLSTSELPAVTRTEPESGPNLNEFSHSPPIFSETEPWPQQLTKLCRESSSALARDPFTEIPLHLPQGDLYLSPKSEESIFGAVATISKAVDQIMETAYQRAFVAIRPPGHHCCQSAPMGFCFLNNVAIAAAHAHLKHEIDRVIILDIDLHHGNGTQEIAWKINAEAHKILHQAKKNSPRKKGKNSTPARPLQIFYGSLHDIYSYPCEDGNEQFVQAASSNLQGAHGQWIANIHLKEFSDETDFYTRVYPEYSKGLLGAAKQFCQTTFAEPGRTLVIISAGFDASVHESVGMSRHRRHVPTSFYYKFTQEATKFASEFAEGKILSVLEGGYSDRALASGTLASIIALSETEQEDILHDDVIDWCQEANLIKLEKACKSKKGKLIGTSSADSPDWLNRTIQIFQQMGGDDVIHTIESDKKLVKSPPTPRSLPFRTRRTKFGENDFEPGSKIPVESNLGGNRAEGVTQVDSLSAAAVARVEPPAASPAQPLASEDVLKPKIRFTFKQAGI